jgi:hypothetical protein
MTVILRFGYTMLGPLLIGVLLAHSTDSQARDEPETVMITYQVKPGQEAALASVIARHWSTARKLDLVHRAPHIVLQGGGANEHYLVEILTWRDASVPDAAPEEITQMWDEMRKLVESRSGRPAIDISPIAVLVR